MKQSAILAFFGRLLLGTMLAPALTIPPAQAEGGKTQSVTNALPEFDLTGFQSGFRCDAKIAYPPSSYLTAFGYKFYEIAVESDRWTYGPVYLIAAQSSARLCPLLFRTTSKFYEPRSMNSDDFRKIRPSPEFDALLLVILRQDTEGCHVYFGLPSSLPQLKREQELDCIYKGFRRLNRKAFAISDDRVPEFEYSTAGVVLDGRIYWGEDR